MADAQESYDLFTDWISDLVPKRARYWSDDPFPFCKDLGEVGLLGADTTGRNTAHSVNGYWRKREDAAARRIASGDRRVLAVHHPPEPDQERTVVGQIVEGYAFGFPDRDFDRPGAPPYDLPVWPAWRGPLLPLDRHCNEFPSGALETCSGV